MDTRGRFWKSGPPPGPGTRSPGILYIYFDPPPPTHCVRMAAFLARHCAIECWARPGPAAACSGWARRAKTRRSRAGPAAACSGWARPSPAAACSGWARPGPAAACSGWGRRGKTRRSRPGPAAACSGWARPSPTAACSGWAWPGPAAACSGWVPVPDGQNELKKPVCKIHRRCSLVHGAESYEIWNRQLSVLCVSFG